MSNKNASLGTLGEDLRVSFRLAYKNAISFLLGLIGVLIVTVIILGIAFGLAMIPITIYYGGFHGIATFFTDLGVILEQAFVPPSSFNPAAMGFVVSIILLFLSPFLIAIGAPFGMAREIVESAGTSAEGVFTWYRKKFFSLAGGGILIFAIALLPLVLMYGSAFFVFGFQVPLLVNSMMASVGGFWLILSLGMLSLVFPAIIDGLSAFSAVKQSIRMGITYFDRVFSTLLAFIGIFVLCAIPLIVGIATIDISAMAILAVVAVPLGLFLVLIALPAFFISLSRIYMILSGIEVAADEPTEPEVSFIGGF
ncbi:MAG: hypothetical protein ACFFAY_01675 [Promethearchaeota archaeon]